MGLFLTDCLRSKELDAASGVLTIVRPATAAGSREWSSEVSLKDSFVSTPRRFRRGCKLTRNAPAPAPAPRCVTFGSMLSDCLCFQTRIPGGSTRQTLRPCPTSLD